MVLLLRWSLRSLSFHGQNKIFSSVHESSQILNAALSVECLYGFPQRNFLPVSVLHSESVFLTSFADLIFPGFLLHYVLSAFSPGLQEKCKPNLRHVEFLGYGSYRWLETGKKTGLHEAMGGCFQASFLEERCRTFIASLHEGDTRTVSHSECHKRVNKLHGSTQIGIFNICTIFFLTAHVSGAKTTRGS